MVERTHQKDSEGKNNSEELLEPVYTPGCKIPGYRIRKSKEEIEADKARYYTEIAESYDELYKEEQVKKIMIIIENLPINKEDSLLDVGCGTGFSFDYWPTKNAIGIEPSSGLIRVSKHQEKILHERAENMPFEDNEFDVVVSVTAIQNFEYLEDGIREIARVGKDRFGLSVLKKSPNFDQIDRLITRTFNNKGLTIKTIDEEKDRIYIITKE